MKIIIVSLIESFSCYHFAKMYLIPACKNIIANFGQLSLLTLVKDIQNQKGYQ